MSNAFVILTNQWMSRFRDAWADPQFFRVLGFANSAGILLPDASLDVDSTILKPINDGTLATRRPADVAFVQVRCTVNYTSLHHKGEMCKCNIDYYVALPQSNVNFNDGDGNRHMRITFGGAADLRTLSKARFAADIFEPFLGTLSPVGILPPKYGSTRAVIDIESKWTQITNKILTTGIESIMASLAQQLAPGFTTTPHATCEQIKAEFTDSTGNKHILSCHHLYHTLMTASIVFNQQPIWLMNLYSHYVRSLAPDTLEAYREETTNYLTFNDLSRDAQQKSCKRR